VTPLFHFSHHFNFRRYFAAKLFRKGPLNRMHNAITIPDILLLIFPELHRSGCSRAARVCHAWSELALGVLWSQGDIHIEELFNTIPALRRAWLMCYVGPEYVAEVRRDPDRLTRSWEEAGSLSSMAVRQRRFSEIGNDGIQEIRSEDLALEFVSYFS